MCTFETGRTIRPCEVQIGVVLQFKSKKHATQLVDLTLANAGRFSHFFYCVIHQDLQ